MLSDNHNTHPNNDTDDLLVSGVDANLRQTELIISLILRTGVFISATLITLGLITFLIQNRQLTATSISAISFPTSPRAVFQSVASGDGRGIIMTGLFVLIATPISRVLISIVTFSIERDLRYVIITVIVLLIILTSFLVGKAGG